MSKTYVIADIHGRHDLLIKALSLIPEDSKIIFTGDYVDRGPDSNSVLKTLIAGQDEGKHWVCLRGNHEQMMVDAFIYPDNEYIWYVNGGDKTLKSYDEGAVSKNHLDWMGKLPYYHEDKHRVYVHAFLSPTVPLIKQSKDVMIWERYNKYETFGWMDKHVVHGHTPYKNGPILSQNRTNLDTSAVHSGRLVVGVFDDSVAGGPVDIIEVLE